MFLTMNESRERERENERRIPQSADEAIGGTFRIQGTYVPNVEEARHLVRHFSPLSGVPVGEREGRKRNGRIRNEREYHGMQAPFPQFPF